MCGEVDGLRIRLFRGLRRHCHHVGIMLHFFVSCQHFYTLVLNVRLANAGCGWCGAPSTEGSMRGTQDYTSVAVGRMVVHTVSCVECVCVVEFMS